MANIMSMSKGSGCGCKINPAVLKDLLHGFTSDTSHENLVVGNSLADDCSVYNLGNGNYLLQTVDFFTPIVNDPYVFGASAAANSLSDIWAMGGNPLMANAVFSWPLDILSIDEGREVLKGAHDICMKAGVPLAGGHSIDGKEPLFGLSVTGICTDVNLKRNKGAMAGDLIILTKPLGTGMLAAAHKRGQSSLQQDEVLFAQLQELNIIGAALGNISGVHAMTDVTGFGLAGHLLEMCRSSGYGAELEFNKIPKIHEALELAEAFVLPDNAMRNWNAYESEIQMLNQAAFPWLIDPQTNGGLLISVDKNALKEVENFGTVIGEFTDEFAGIKVE